MSHQVNGAIHCSIDIFMPICRVGTASLITRRHWPRVILILLIKIKSGTVKRAYLLASQPVPAVPVLTAPAAPRASLRTTLCASIDFL